MAVTPSVTGTAVYNSTAATTQNFSGFTVVAGDELALFFIFQDSASSNVITSCTWDSGGSNQACTLIKTQALAGANGGISVFGVINPVVGNKTLSVVQPLNNAMTAEMQTYTGTLHSTVALTCINATSTTGATVTPSSTQATNNVGDMCIGAFGTGTGSTISATNNTNIYILNDSATHASAANRAAGTGASITLNATQATGIAWGSLSFTIVQGGPVGAAQLDLSAKPFRVPSAGFDKSRALNLNLFKNPIPFFNSFQGRGATAPLSSPAQPYNLALYTPVTVATAQPRTSYLSPPYALPPFRPDASRGLNLSLQPVVVAAPFAQYSWPSAVTLKRAVDATQPSNPNLFTNPLPFAQYDWSKPVRLAPERPDVARGLNINLFTNPIPFGPFDWNKAVQIAPERPDPNRSLNINLFTNPIPFFNPPSVGSPAQSRAPDQGPYNQNVYAVTVVAVPFAQLDWSRPAKPPASFPAQSFNLALYNDAATTTLRKPFIFPANLVQPVRPDASRGLNLNLTVVVTAAPFVPVDFSKSFFPKVQSDASQPLNLQLFTNPIPIFNTDYSAITPRIPRAPDQVAYNLNTYTVVVVAAPFVPIDYSKPFFPRVLPPDPPALNLQLFTNPIPFGPFDWSKPVATPRFLPDASFQLNLALNFTVQVMPFAQYDWSKSALPNIPAPRIYQRDPTNFANPIPFAQLDWSKPMRGTLVLQPATLTQALPLRATVVVSTELHARPFIGANMGWKTF
jgi:hypothetical protein